MIVLLHICIANEATHPSKPNTLTICSTSLVHFPIWRRVALGAHKQNGDKNENTANY